MEKATSEPRKKKEYFIFFVFQSVCRANTVNMNAAPLNTSNICGYDVFSCVRDLHGPKFFNFTRPGPRIIWPDPARARSLSSNMLPVPHLSTTSFYSILNEARSIYNLPSLSIHPMALQLESGPGLLTYWRFLNLLVLYSSSGTPAASAPWL
jgi:hypothetical protein